MATPTATTRDHLRVSYEDDRGHLLIDGPPEMFRDYLRLSTRCDHPCAAPPRDGEAVAAPPDGGRGAPWASPSLGAGDPPAEDSA